MAWTLNSIIVLKNYYSSAAINREDKVKANMDLYQWKALRYGMRG